MNERLAPRNRPDDDTLGHDVGSAMPESHEDNERNAREHFELRFEWANAVAKIRDEPMPDILSGVTDLYARIFGRRVDRSVVEADSRWQDFVSMLREGADPVATAMAWREKYYKGDEAQEEGREFFGPFRYDYDAATQTVDVHFGSMGWSAEDRDSPKILPSVDIKSSLTDMFRTIKQRHADAKTVHGGSWLLTRVLESKHLRKLLSKVLPESFIASSAQGSRGAQGGGRWGQLVDDNGNVHKKSAEQFRANIKDPRIMTPDAYMNAFPLAPTLMTAPIEDFYTFYGIK